MPDKQERDLWWAFLEGRPESEWNPPKQPKQKKIKGFQASAQPEHAHDEGEVELALRVDPTESFPTPSCTPVGSDDIEESTTSDESHTLAFKPRAPTPLLLKYIDQVNFFYFVMDTPQADVFNSDTLCISLCTLHIGSISISKMRFHG